ncbi:MAG: molybdate ABC transporter substrate-binding protein [Burkholderiales bacterium]
MKTIVAMFAGWMLACGAAFAAEITVLSGGAIEPGLKAAAAAFEKESGHTVKITFNTTPQMQKRIAGGDRFDVAIAPPAAIKTFTQDGKVEAGGANVGRVGLGAVVRPGAPQPDLASAESLKRSVLEAESIVFNRASTGIYFENLLKKMGIYDQVEGKTTRYPDGASVMEHVLKGKGREVCFGPITEILLYRDKGLRLVGALPAEVQNYTSYTAVPMAGGASMDAARALVKFLGSPAGKKHFAAAGIE